MLVNIFCNSNPTKNKIGHPVKALGEKKFRIKTIKCQGTFTRKIKTIQKEKTRKNRDVRQTSSQNAQNVSSYESACTPIDNQFWNMRKEAEDNA